MIRPFAARMVLLGTLFLLVLRISPARAAPVTKKETGFTIVLQGPQLSADVFIDGEKVGQTPIQGVTAAAPGEHTIRVAKMGYVPFIDVFKVKDGKVTKLEVELAPVAGVLALSANVDQARVFLDRRYMGDAPLSLEVKVGLHEVRVTRFGYKEETFTFNAVAGEEETRAVKLAELPPELNPYKPPPPPPPKWYERWWVWAAGAGGVAVIAVSVIVPATLAARPPCDQIGGKICFDVPAAQAPSSLLLLGRF